MIDNNGYVTVDNTIIISNGCWVTQKIRSMKITLHHQEIFVISQLWGIGYFHANIENIPRLALYIPFLRKYSHIKIHVATKARYIVDNLNVLGIMEDRLITGLTKGDIIYLPQGTGCGDINQPSGHLLSLYYHHYIKTNLLKLKSTDGSVITNMTEYFEKEKPHQNPANDTGLTENQWNCSKFVNLIDQLNHLATKHKEK